MHQSTIETIRATDRLERRYLYRALKRVFDIAFSLAVLILLGWLYILVAVLIKIDDPAGPVLFVQERVGKNGVTFDMLKFRSMCVDAESRLDALQELNERDGPVFKMHDDPRVTRVGRFIRRTNIDELPQFINVLMGQMSVVGPRPALPHEVAQYNDYQRLRLLAKPGITCLWQIDKDRDHLTFDEWVERDLLYTQTCSAATDLKIIVQTVFAVLGGQGS